LFLENTPFGNNFTGFQLKDDSDEIPSITPPNAYVSNGCIWNSEAPTFTGQGEVTLKNGFVQRGLHYFIFNNSDKNKALNLKFNKVHFSGQFRDGLIMGSDESNVSGADGCY
jgi:hypothetical protein